MKQTYKTVFPACNYNFLAEFMTSEASISTSRVSLISDYIYHDDFMIYYGKHITDFCCPKMLDGLRDLLSHTEEDVTVVKCVNSCKSEVCFSLEPFFQPCYQGKHSCC